MKCRWGTRYEKDRLAAFFSYYFRQLMVFWGLAVVQLVEGFFFGIILPAALGPVVDSAPNRGEYQECFLGRKGGRCLG
jgi:hypothetical protein